MIAAVPRDDLPAGGAGHAQHVVQAHHDVGDDDGLDRAPEAAAVVDVAGFVLGEQQANADPQQQHGPDQLEIAQAEQVRGHRGERGHQDDDPGSAHDEGLPLLPGFREMAIRRMSEQRGRLVGELTEQRRSAGLSQTEVAARMGTSQSAVARLEAGDVDVRASTLERYAAAIGSQITWRLEG